MKKIWGMITILGMTVCLLAGCGNDKKAAQDGSTSAENETAMENGTGSGSVISIGDSYYYDLLTSETGDIYALTDGEAGTVFVNETPFYATMGGQTADTGYIRTAEGEFRVEDTVKMLGGKVGHIGRVTKGMIKVGDTVTLEVDAKRRSLIAKNHSATHLLQKALRNVLGSHVEQKGSDVNPDRLRFDFSHFSAMTEEELKQVETIVNEKIAEALPVET